jgi:hypothetical protein
MHLRKLLAIAGVSALSLVALRASAQNEAPFTIRYPPDGATVRENVRVEVPLASIPPESYVAYSIDGQFKVALSPTAEQRINAARKPGARFVFVWNTKDPMKVRGSVKEVQPKDGEHEITATLYVPAAGGAQGATVAKQTSSVKVNLRNKIAEDPGPIRLRYRFADGTSRYYNRKGDTSIVAGLSQGVVQGTNDQELVAQRSRLMIAVEDKYPDQSAIIRNKLTDLTVRQGGQETEYPSDVLPKSLYQQITSKGDVVYQNETPSYEQFAQLGVPVDTTINLPKLPERTVRIGDKWVSAKERLDIPGTPPNQQPVVAMESTLEGLEWEGGYPTAKIHQVFDSTKGGGYKAPKSIVFGNMVVDGPQLKYERDIYIAYRSGTLVKMVRRMEVTGKTAGGVQTGGGPGMAGGMPGRPGGMMGGPGMGAAGMEGMGGEMAGRPGGGAPGGDYGSMMSRSMQGSMAGRGRSGGAASMGGLAGGPSIPGGGGGPPPGMMRGGPRGGMMGSSAMMGPGMRGGIPGAPGMGAGAMGGGTGTGSTQVTLKSTTVTELDRSGVSVAGL